MCVYITTPDCDVQEWQRAMILFSFVGSDYLQTCLVVHKKNTCSLFHLSFSQSSFFVLRIDLSPPAPPSFLPFLKGGGVGKKAPRDQKNASQKNQVAIKYARANIEYK